MPHRDRPYPTPSELEILQVLWEDGDLTVGEVVERLSRRRQTGYTTALKLLQLMHGKGLVRRDETERAHRYAAAVGEEETQGRVLRSMVKQAFSGSVAKLMMRALATQRPTQDELREIEKLLKHHRGKRK